MCTPTHHRLHRLRQLLRQLLLGAPLSLQSLALPVQLQVEPVVDLLLLKGGTAGSAPRNLPISPRTPCHKLPRDQLIPSPCACCDIRPRKGLKNGKLSAITQLEWDKTPIFFHPELPTYPLGPGDVRLGGGVPLLGRPHAGERPLALLPAAQLQHQHLDDDEGIFQPPLQLRA